MDKPTTIETTIRNVDPRLDKDLVLTAIGRVLDDADPDERPAVQITRWLG